jgi:hypothetical protein
VKRAGSTIASIHLGALMKIKIKGSMKITAVDDSMVQVHVVRPPHIDALNKYSSARFYPLLKTHNGLSLISIGPAFAAS